MLGRIGRRGSGGIGGSGAYEYQAISDTLPPRVRIPKKVASAIKVEAKVWFANERSA